METEGPVQSECRRATGADLSSQSLDCPRSESSEACVKVREEGTAAGGSRHRRDPG